MNRRRGSVYDRNGVPINRREVSAVHKGGDDAGRLSTTDTLQRSGSRAAWETGVQTRDERRRGSARGHASNPINRPLDGRAHAVATGSISGRTGRAVSGANINMGRPPTRGVNPIESTHAHSDTKRNESSAPRRKLTLFDHMIVNAPPVLDLKSSSLEREREGHAAASRRGFNKDHPRLLSDMSARSCKGRKQNAARRYQRTSSTPTLPPGPLFDKNPSQERMSHINSLVAPRTARAGEPPPKPGKQREEPRKRKLSTLKKHILLHRAQKWQQLKEDLAHSTKSTAFTDNNTHPHRVYPKGLCASPSGHVNLIGMGLRMTNEGFSREEHHCSTLTVASGGPKDAISGKGCPGVDGRSTIHGSECRGTGNRVGREPESSVVMQCQQHAVIIHNLVEEEDIEDDEEHAEIVQDVRDMLSIFDNVLSVDIPRKQQLGVGTVTVAFSTLVAADIARSWFHGRIIGGKSLEANVVPRRLKIDDMGSQSPTPEGESEPGMKSQEVELEVMTASDISKENLVFLRSTSSPLQPETRSNGDGRESSWRVVVRNLVEDEDLEDDDNYEEICADIYKMVNTYGHVKTLEIPREAGGDKGSTQPGEVVAVFGSLTEAETCAAGMKGRRVGGKDLDAEVLGPSEPSCLAGAQPDGGCVETQYSTLGANGAPVSEHTDVIPPCCTTYPSVECGWWRVVISDLVDEEDLEDDDDYEEVVKDVTAMCGAYGNVCALDIPRGPRHDGKMAVGAAVACFASRGEANACACGFQGRRIGGNTVRAELLGPGKGDVTHSVAESQSTEISSGKGVSALKTAFHSEQSVRFRIPEGAVEARAGYDRDDESSRFGKGQEHEEFSQCLCSAPSVGGSPAFSTSEGNAGLTLGSEATCEAKAGSICCDGSKSSASQGAPESLPGAPESPPPAANDSLLTMTGDKRTRKFPDKYRDAAALPRLPNQTGGRPNSYVDQVSALYSLVGDKPPTSTIHSSAFVKVRTVWCASFEGAEAVPQSVLVASSTKT